MKLNFYSMLLLVLGSLARAADPPAGDDGMGGDIGGTATAQVVDWFPVIRSLYVESAAPGTQAEARKVPFEPFTTNALPSEQLQWEALRKIVERRAADGAFPPYSPSEQMVCGWRYVVDTASGKSGYEIEIAKPGEPPAVLERGTNSLIHVNFDVIMTTDPDNKRRYLQKYLHFVRQEISIWPVQSAIDARVKDPAGPEAMAAYHAPVEATPAMLLANYDGAQDVIRPAVLDADGNLAVYPRYEFKPATPGVYEIRVKFVVAGKLPGQDKETVKQVQSAIRVAYLNTLDVNFTKIMYDSRRARTSKLGYSGTK